LIYITDIFVQTLLLCKCSLFYFSGKRNIFIFDFLEASQSCETLGGPTRPIRRVVSSTA